jgi:hypothetical protein
MSSRKGQQNQFCGQSRIELETADSTTCQNSPRVQLSSAGTVHRPKSKILTDNAPNKSENASERALSKSAQNLNFASPLRPNCSAEFPQQG